MAVPGLIPSGGDLLQFAGGLYEGRKQRQAAAAQWEDQKRFSRGQLEHNINVARKHGLDPLAVLGGASSVTPSPQSVFTNPSGRVGASLSKLGQNLNRSAMANASKHTRQMAELQLENQKTRNQLLNLELEQMRARMARSQLPPPGVAVVPVEQEAKRKGRPFDTTGDIAEGSWVDVPGGVTRVPSKGFKERTEEDIISSGGRLMRGLLKPVRPSMKHLRKKFPGAYRWGFDGVNRVWYPQYRKSHRNYKKRWFNYVEDASQWFYNKFMRPKIVRPRRFK